VSPSVAVCESTNSLSSLPLSTNLCNSQDVSSGYSSYTTSISIQFVVLGEMKGVSFSSSLLDMEETYLCVEEKLKLRPIEIQSKTLTHKQFIPFTYIICGGNGSIRCRTFGSNTTSIIIIGLYCWYLGRWR
jgi:hypothetical protein